MARFFIDRPVFAIVLSLFIVIGGLVSIAILPIAQYPQITAPRVVVSAYYIGANAEVVEQSVAQSIEPQVNGVEGMQDMQSTSDNAGNYTLNVTFELDRDADMMSVQVQNRVAQANSLLPSEVMSAGVTTSKESADVAMYFSLYSPTDEYDSLFLKNYASINIIDDIKRITGIGGVQEYGSEFGMRIWLQPDKMARLGVTSTDVANAVMAQNVQAPAGIIGQYPSAPGQQFQYSAQVKGRLVSPQEFENIIIRANKDGSYLKVKDVARVELSAKDYYFLSDTNGHDSVVFAISLTTDANAMETISKVNELLQNASKKFPPGVVYKVVSDNTLFIKESLKEVIHTFFEALILVLIVVFIFLQNWRATVIPMLAVPVSLIGTFAAFVLLGFSINTLTLFAMVLAIGLVVDDAIVVVEAVEHHIQHTGLAPRDATYRAMREVSGPVVAIAFVLASVFIPVAFFGGTVGVLYQQFALTISISMALSAFIALTLTPVLCSMMLKSEEEKKDAKESILTKFFIKFNIWFEKTTETYGHYVAKCIDHYKTTLCGLLAIMMLAMAFMYVLPSSFVPDEDQGYFMTAMILPEASSLARTREVGNAFGAKVAKIPGVENVIIVSGYDVLTSASKPNCGIVILGLKPWAERKSSDLQVQGIISKVMNMSRQEPEAVFMAFNAPVLPGASNTGALSLSLMDRGGGTVQDMSDLSQQFITAAKKRPEVGSIFTTFSVNTPGYRFEVDRDKSAALGVPVNQVFSALQTFLGGQQVNDFNLFGRTWKVVMQAEPEFRANVDTLRFFFVRSDTGSMVPLNTLVKPASTIVVSSIKRYNGLRAFQIGGDPAEGYSTGQAMTALEEVAAEVLPDTYTYEWYGQSRDEKESGGRSAMVFGFAILFAFLCLAALYESWSIPFAVLLSVPTAVMGAAGLQYIAGLENNVYMQIGLVMLIGLAAKNAILIVEFAKLNLDNGMKPAEAAIAAAKLRLRPILMTSFAFIIGCLPLALAAGAGAGARNAMGTAVVGGMTTATFLGIFIVPTLFVAIEGLQNYFGKKEENEL